MRRQLTAEEMLEVIKKVIERHFGSEAYAQLLQWIKTRCEEEGCENVFDYVCSYCGMRLCNLHAVFGEGQLVYCRLHADPGTRLADVFLVPRW